MCVYVCVFVVCCSKFSVPKLATNTNTESLSLTKEQKKTAFCCVTWKTAAVLIYQSQGTVSKLHLTMYMVMHETDAGYGPYNTEICSYFSDSGLDKPVSFFEIDVQLNWARDFHF